MAKNKAYLNGEWEYEGFLNQNGAEAGIKFGFVCLGQGGGNIGDAFASIRNPSNNNPVYPVLCFNTNIGDLDLKNVEKHNKIVLKGSERGAGMNPERGRQAIEENGKDVFEAISRTMKDVDAVIVIASLGGGTGTGGINMVTDVIADFLMKPVMAIVSLPNPHIDENINAFHALKELVPKLEEVRGDETGGVYRGLENIAILDNKKIIEEHLEAIDQGDPEASKLSWYKYSNYKVASIFHEWNVTTTLKSDKTLDAEDLKNKILFTGGVLTFAKKKINLQDNELKSENDLINEVVSTYRGRNVLANGFDYANDAKAFGLHVMMPKGREDLFNSNTLEKIYKRLQEELPNVPIYYGKSTWDSNSLLVYTITSLKGLPERARNLKEESDKLIQIQKERENKASGFNISGDLDGGRNSNPFLRGRNTTQQRREVPVNPFLAKKEAAPTRPADNDDSDGNPFTKYMKKS